MIRFAAIRQLKTFTLNVKFESDAPVTALVGPSGAGKSTVLNIMAGLISPASGYFAIGQSVIFDTVKKIMLPPHRRSIGYVFQDGLLFPHLSVEGNLRYGHRPGPHDFAEVTEFLKIKNLLRRRPATLSGGERQRVALGRALLSQPSLLLLDEPMANLDSAHKDEIFPYLENLHQRFGVPMLLVSHNEAEVARLATRVFHMESGRISKSVPARHLQRGVEPPFANGDNA